MSDEQPDSPSPIGDLDIDLAPPVPKGLGKDTPAAGRYAKLLEVWVGNWTQRAKERDAARALFEARADTRAKITADAKVVEVAVANARDDTDDANEFSLVKALHDAYIATTQSSLDRAFTRLNYVTGAVAAVTAIYTTMLGLTYSLPKGNGATLDFSAFIPVVFLGLTQLLVTVYAALFRKQREDISLLPSASDTQMVQ